MRSPLCIFSTFSNLVVNPMVLTAKRSAVWQQTICVFPKVDIGTSCEPLGGVRRCRQVRTSALEIPLRRIWGRNPAAISVFHCLVSSLALLLCSAQFRIAKSPNHPAEIDEKRAHDHNHERVGLYHSFGDCGRHFAHMQELLNGLPKVWSRGGSQQKWHHRSSWTTQKRETDIGRKKIPGRFKVDYYGSF